MTGSQNVKGLLSTIIWSPITEFCAERFRNGHSSSSQLLHERDRIDCIDEEMDARFDASVLGDQPRNGRRNNGIHPVLATPLEAQLMALRHVTRFTATPNLDDVESANR
jgi:hypothetical protein